ncbi:MAG: tRNA (adenosine(37)-N6)-threonylcarbamoyltransferase complex ATPase subunit type 1 TsaE [Puniceicoccales bacterium]|jgi:tRNA threonylcarbamoyladenosine biosynthesis protein TsaE|nr:tRNA (adenosine(37)-N6)-threonylcarbamoyltransferase complex ATPase subunit type 1 TsaE [Puniceicoccales bacterium]
MNIVPPYRPGQILPLSHWRTGITSRSIEETAALAAALTALLPENTALALHGDLGSGKTTFVRGMARALGLKEPITSPTFALFFIYETKVRQLVHMDAYRLQSPADADTLVLWDLLRSPWTLVVEWPEKLGDRLPENAWHLEFSIEAPGIHRLRLSSGEMAIATSE